MKESSMILAERSPKALGKWKTESERNRSVDRKSKVWRCQKATSQTSKIARTNKNFTFLAFRKSQKSRSEGITI
ncbi:27716_t:CDS:2 [Dentiscutata erythropus]|uniref:27716_t:CDS:1 n=1 Tax=Dentiscutata erythropus TaxID=1348616 RepID=A0A9N9HTC4_9GLOM|nr:27716_t:CDS:2 [Dentiscutata erythropus]